MAFWGLIKGNVEKFLEQLHHRLALHIIGLINMGGLDDALFEKSMSTFSKNHHEYAFVQRGDRSVQAHINDVFMSLQHEQYRWEDDIPSEEELIISDLRHNDTLRKRRQDKDYLLPHQELFRNWLDSYGNVHQQNIKHAINKYQHKIHQLWGFPFDIDVDALNLDELVGEDELATTQEPSTSNNVIPFKPR